MATSTAKKDFVRTRRLVQVFAPRRSGHHAIMWWILSQLRPPTKRLNNRCLPLTLRRPQVDWYDYDAQPLMNVVMANYEDREPFRVYRVTHQEHKPIVSGLEAQCIQYVLILRDAFNNLASKKRANPERGLAEGQREAALWKALAREYLGITNYLPNKTVVNYNRWFAKRDYRMQLAGKLQLDLDADHPDAEKARLAVPGGFGRSQFDGREYDGSASEMDVLNRWKAFEDDPEFLELLRDKELIALSDRIFQMEGIETLLKRVSRYGDCGVDNLGQVGPERVPPTYWTLDEHKRKHTYSVSLARALESVLPADVPVLDLGCGLGHYLASLHEAGYRCLGVEGTPGITAVSVFDNIVQADLSQPLSLDWPKSSILCLEVAEHLRLEDEPQLLDTIDQYCAEWLVLSWAVPGQGGHKHLNERPNSYVYHRFAQRGFMFQAAETFLLRESIGRKAKWFRNTIMVFKRA